MSTQPSARKRLASRRKQQITRRPTNLPLSVYIPGTTIIHRIDALWKIAAVIAVVVFNAIFIKTVIPATIVLGVVAVLYIIARIPLKIVWSQVASPLIILVPLVGFQVWRRGLEYSSVLFLTIFSALLLASLLTLTSTVDEIMNALNRALKPLERFGFPAELVSLAMALAIRLIPLMFATVYEVLDARKARGAGFSVVAFGTPVLIRTIRRARAMGEALQARGVGD